MDSRANVLSLCAGGGGLDLGIRLAVPSARTVCYVENEVTACGVLAARMEDGGLDDAPIWTDLRTFDGAAWRGAVDWVIGGYPCQPFSNAGKRLGAEDPRHLWPYVERIVADVAPRFCFFENVGAHLRLGAREVIRDLQALGYRTAATLLTASEVGAPHGRERLFILAHSEGVLQREQDDAGRSQPRRDAWGDVGWERGDVADTGDGFIQESWRGSQGRDGAGSTGASHVADASLERGEGQRLHVRRGEPRQPSPLTHGRSSDVADAHLGSGSAEPRQQHQERAEVALAHSNSAGRQQVARGASGDEGADEGRAALHGHEPASAQPDVADPAGSRRAGAEDTRADRGDAAAYASRSVESQRASSDVADTSGRQRSVFSRGDELPAWPPSPSDTDAWRRVLAIRPDLAPALSIAEEDALGIRYSFAAKKAQPKVRDLADGLGRGMDLSRGDQLHILGNGVVPRQAAYALSLLMEAMAE